MIKCFLNIKLYADIKICDCHQKICGKGVSKITISHLVDEPLFDFCTEMLHHVIPDRVLRLELGFTNRASPTRKRGRSMLQKRFKVFNEKLYSALIVNHVLYLYTFMTYLWLLFEENFVQDFREKLLKQSMLQSDVNEHQILFFAVVIAGVTVERVHNFRFQTLQFGAEMGDLK